MGGKIPVFALIVAAFLLTVDGKTVLRNEFAKLVEVNEKFVKFQDFKFYKKSRAVGALNMTYTTKVDIVSDDQVRMQVAALQLKGNEYKRTVIDFSLGICNLYQANKFNALSIIKNSNLTGCPFPKGAYYINDISPGTEMLPPYFPEGRWMLDISFTYHDQTMVRLNWMLAVVKAM